MWHKNMVGATKAEKARFLQILALGCVICGHDNHNSKLEIHHLIEGNKRMGHGYTICLCAYHHRGVGQVHAQTALSHGSKPFTQAYGTQRSLWEATQRRLGLEIDWPASKILPRRISNSTDWA